MGHYHEISAREWINSMNMMLILGTWFITIIGVLSKGTEAILLLLMPLAVTTIFGFQVVHNRQEIKKLRTA